MRTIHVFLRRVWAVYVIRPVSAGIVIIRSGNNERTVRVDKNILLRREDELIGAITEKSDIRLSCARDVWPAAKANGLVAVIP